MIEASATGILGASCEPALAACRYTCTSQWAKARTTARGKLLPACVPPTAYANGSALAFYNSTTYRDDMVWAAGWMYKATGERVRKSSHTLVPKHATIICGVQTLPCLLSSAIHPPLMLPRQPRMRGPVSFILCCLGALQVVAMVHDHHHLRWKA